MNRISLRSTQQHDQQATLLGEDNPSASQVLVVEDEGIIARDLASMLKDLGYGVSGQAGSGSDAIEIASTTKTDVVLMDIKIRGSMDGIETAAVMRNFLKIPVIFLTAHADTATLDRANMTEPFGYVVKPFSGPDLKAALALALNRHRLQMRSEARESWSRSALQHLPDALITTDRAGRIISLNLAAEQITGHAAHEAEGRLLPNILSLESAGQVLDIAALLEQTRLKRLGSLQDCLVCNRDGKSPIAIVVSEISSGQHGSGFAVLLRDLTPAQGSADYQLQELSYALSNELRDPVRNLACFSQLLQRKRSSMADQDSHDYLDFILSASKRLESQMSGLRTFHLAGAINLESNVVADANVIFADAIQFLGSRLREVGAAVLIDPLPAIAMSSVALREVANQLLTNCIRFRSDRPLVIYITAQRQDDAWKFTVTDNGSGFEQEQAERIFHLFTKAHGPHISGSGIGLAICKRLVERSGGRIWAEPAAEGGSSFYFTAQSVEQPEK